MVEARIHPRIQTSIPVSFASHEFDGRQNGTMFNVSLVGCAVESPTTVEPGTHMALYLHAPGEPTPIAIELASIVRAGRQDFAVKFVMVAPKERERLEQLVRKLFKAST